MSSYTYSLRYACVHVSVSQQLTSIPFALLALSHSRDVPELPRGGEARILLLAVEENRGEEMKGTPLISYTSNLTH